MKVGNLVYEAATCRYGFVERIDVDYYGACDGRADRILVCWTDGPPEYLESHELETVDGSV